jgi:hypothetical protein
MKKNAKSKRLAAERAAVHYAYDVCGCVHHAAAIRTQWQRQDIFAADVVGKRRDGSHVYLQVTAGQAAAVTARRRKLEAISWHDSDAVYLLQLVQTEDPACGKRTLWFFRVHAYVNFGHGANERRWTTWEAACPVPAEWFKARKG